MSILPFLLLSQVISPIAHFDAGQTGWNPSETILTTANVASGKFGKLGSWNLDGLVFTQPLYVRSGSTNLVIVGTLNNTLFAFNADKPGTAAVWSVNFGTGRLGWSNNSDTFFYCVPASCNIGIVGSPVIDAVGGFVYVVSATSTPSYLLHKLNLADGAAAISAVTISASVTGTGSPGDPTSGPNLLFSATTSNQRCALALSPDASKVYITFGGGSAGFIPPPWHGWVLSYQASNLTQLAAFSTTPNSWGGSVWMSGGAPAIDAAGNVYVLSGAEGTWDGITGFSDSILKLSPSLALLSTGSRLRTMRLWTRTITTLGRAG